LARDGAAISAEDRIAIDDLMRSFAYCNDTADFAGMAALFTDDSALEQGGHRYEGRDGVLHFATSHGAQPNRRGRQHLMQRMLVKPTGEGVKVRSYWMVVQAVAKTGEKFIRSIGYYDDVCVKQDGRWLFKSKKIATWTDETTPPPF
jgi:hypothetical protein